MTTRKKTIVTYSISVVFLLLFFAVFYNTLCIEVHDNLDQTTAWLNLLKENEAFFSSNDKILPFMNGLQRSLFSPETQLINILYLLFPPLLYHIVVIILKFSIAFFSFNLLAKYLVRNYDDIAWFVLILSVSFGLIPGYENLYFAIASLPLITYLYIRFLDERRLFLLSCIFLYPILSDITRFGMFILFFMGVHSIVLFFQKKYTQMLGSALSVFVLTLGYILVEYRLIYSMILAKEPSMRKATILIPERNFIKVFFEGLLHGQYHFYSFSYIFLLFIFYLIYIVKKKKLSLNKDVVIVASIIVFNCFLYALYLTTDFSNFLGDIISPLAGWNFYRSLWFNAFLWHLLAVLLIQNTYPYIKKNVLFFFCCIQLSFVVISPVYGNFFYYTLKGNISSLNKHTLSHKEFYSENLFKDIKQKINYKNDQKVLAYGFHPAVLTFNGFFTVDGYHNAYYLKDKLRFRKLIEPGLNLSEKNKKYFDDWGGRAYVFSEEVSYRPTREKHDSEVGLPINYDIAREMDIKYVISNYPLKPEKNLVMKGIYTADRSPYVIRVYSIVY